MDAWTEGLSHGRIHGWMDGWMDGWRDGYHSRLGRPSGHFMFSLIGLMRILFTNIFQRL